MKRGTIVDLSRGCCGIEASQAGAGRTSATGRGSRRIALCLLFTFALASVLSLRPVLARVLPDEVENCEEIEFVIGNRLKSSIKGLKDWGFYNLAIDHLERTRQNDALPEIVRIESSYFLGDIYVTAGDEAAKQFDSKTKLDDFKKADAEFSRYLKDVREYYAKSAAKIDQKVLNENLADVHFERGRMNEELAMDRGEAYQYVVEKEEKTKYKAEAEKDFAKATEDFDLAAKFYKDRRDFWEKNFKTQKDKEKYWYFRNKAAFAMSHRSWTYFHFSKIYDGKDEKAKKDSKLSIALAEFQQLAKEYSLYNIGLRGQRGAGLCMVHLGKFDDAMKTFLEVMKATRSQDTTEILRLTRYNMAVAYNMMGKPDNAEKARVETSMLLADLERPTTRLNQSLRNLRLATYLEDSKALFTLAARAKARWQRADKQGNKQQASLYNSEREAYFYQARSQIEMVSHAQKSPWRRNGQQMLADLPALSENILGQKLKESASVYTYMSRAQKLMEEKKLLDAKRAFEDAIRVADPKLYGKSLIPECWYQIGLIYYDLPKQLARSQQDRGHNYYFESASVFDHIAREYPNAENDMGKQAAYAAKEFFGALFKQRQKMKLPLNYDAERYYRALVLFANVAPDHPAVRKAKYEAAGIARTIENYAEAADIYRSLKQEDYGFLEGKYLAGYCYWLQALKLYELNIQKMGRDKPRTDYVTSDVAKSRDKAIAYYKEFFKWYADNKALINPVLLWQTNRWVARAKLSLAKLYVHDMSAEYPEVLKLLANFDQGHIELDKQLSSRVRGGQSHEAWKMEIYPDVLFAEINAYRLSDQFAQAESKALKIFKEFGPHELSVRAARLVAYAFFFEREKLAEQKPRDEKKIKDYTEKYVFWITRSIQYDKSQTLDSYIRLAKELYGLKQYQESYKWLEEGQSRFEKTMTQDQRFRLMSLLAQSTFELAKWQDAYKYYSWLLKQNSNDVVAWERIAVCYEKLNYFKYAVIAWRKVKYICDNVRAVDKPKYQPLLYKSIVRLAEAYCREEKPDKERAARILLYQIDRDPNMLRDQEIRSKVAEIFATYFPDKKPELQKWLDKTAQ